MEVHQAMLDVRDRYVGLRGAEAVAGALELVARFLCQPARAIRRTFGVLDPAEQQQALAAPDRLIQRREVALAALDRESRALVVAELELDLARDRLAQRLAKHVVTFFEDRKRLLDQLETLVIAALLAHQVALQAQAVG